MGAWLALLLAVRLEASVAPVPALVPPSASALPRAAAGFFRLEGDEEERRFLARALAGLASSAAGERLLAELMDEYRAAGRRPALRMADFPGSELKEDDLGQRIIGQVAGADGAEGVVTISRSYLGFRSRADAELDAAVNLAHECDHLFTRARVGRRAPRFHDVFSFDLMNELSARLSEGLVAVELGRPRRARDARELIQYWDEEVAALKLRSERYAESLDPGELRDPRAAYESRLRALASRREFLSRELAAIPGRLEAIRHLESVHGLAGRLDSIKRIESGNLPGARSDLERALAASELVASRLEDLDTPFRREWLSRAREASEDPDYLEIHRRARSTRSRLAAALGDAPPPPARPDGQIGWREFLELVERDKRENPSHWPED